MNDIVVDIEYLTVAMGDQAYEFIEVMRIVEDIIEKPNDYLGMQSSKYAAFWSLNALKCPKSTIKIDTFYFAPIAEIEKSRF